MRINLEVESAVLALQDVSGVNPFTTHLLVTKAINDVAPLLLGTPINHNIDVTTLPPHGRFNKPVRNVNTAFTGVVLIDRANGDMIPFSTKSASLQVEANGIALSMLEVTAPSLLASIQRADLFDVAARPTEDSDQYFDILPKKIKSLNGDTIDQVIDGGTSIPVNIQSINESKIVLNARTFNDYTNALTPNYGLNLVPHVPGAELIFDTEVDQFFTTGGEITATLSMEIDIADGNISDPTKNLALCVIGSSTTLTGGDNLIYPYQYNALSKSAYPLTANFLDSILNTGPYKNQLMNAAFDLNQLELNKTNLIPVRDDSGGLIACNVQSKHYTGSGPGENEHRILTVGRISAKAVSL